MRHENHSETLAQVTADYERLYQVFTKGSRQLRTLEWNDKQGKKVDPQEIEKTREWLKSIEGKLNVLKLRKDNLQQIVSNRGQQIKSQTASGKRIRL